MSSASSDPAAPTAPRPVDAQGHDLDEWGLPISGPARVRRLAELGRPDPNIDPASWESGAVARPRAARALRGRKGKVIVDEAASFSPPLTTDAAEGDSSIPADAALTENGNG